MTDKNWNNDLDWKNVHYRVYKIQTRIAKATRDGDWERVIKLTKLVLNSYYCKLVAVRRVTSKKVRRKAGVDGVFWETDKEKFKQVSLLNYRDYAPMPFKRLYVPKDHDRSKLRPLSIPVIFDRAMQGLLLIAIDPIVETLSEPHSYGFRLYRNSQDTIRDVCNSFKFCSGNSWVLKADVRECFDRVSHSWLLENLPVDKKLLKSILKCGYIQNNRFYATKEGVPQGGVLSPVLINFVLTGMETILKYEYPNVHMVRFVDDFLFSGESEQELQAVLNELKSFLKVRNLTLSAEKTEIKRISEGVDFIGWHLQKQNNVLEISPTALSLNEVFIRIVNTELQANHWSPDAFITKLNYIVAGWGYYHAYDCLEHNFIDLDMAVADLVWKWLCKKYPTMSELDIAHTFWNVWNGNDRCYFYNNIKLLRFQDIEVRSPEELILTKNAYLDRAYFRNRKRVYKERLLV
ncbi:MAG: reverse transcriptase domain-containing protein [Clostridia bacterium]|jgi:RNA-directed DNA polymerase|nr:reverse transcriptase domain-containing protein [Clostridia bacterium]